MSDDRAALADEIDAAAETDNDFGMPVFVASIRVWLHEIADRIRAASGGADQGDAALAEALSHIAALIEVTDKPGDAT